MKVKNLTPGTFWKFPNEEYFRYCSKISVDHSITGIIGMHVPMLKIEFPIRSSITCPQDQEIKILELKA